MQVLNARWRARLGTLALSGVIATGVIAVTGPADAATLTVTAQPNSNLDASVQNVITVNGTGFDDAQSFDGVYAGLVPTSKWTPGQTPSFADFIGATFVPKQTISSGAFQTTVTVPANAVTDPSASYVIGTFCAHACAANNRTLDASTPVTFAGPAVTASPNTNLDSTVESVITVNGTAYQGAQAFNGVYTGLVLTSKWTPGQTPNAEDFIGAAFVPKQTIVNGAFQTTVTVPAGAVTDPSASYVIGTFCAHACAVTNRTLDASTPVTFAPLPAVTAQPNSNLDASVQNVITVNGTGYEGAQAFNGVYAGLIATAKWVPGQTPNFADFIGATFVPKQTITGGAFQTTVTVPAGAVTDPGASYVIGTICAHACSLTNRTLDAATPVTFQHAPGAPAAVRAWSGSSPSARGGLAVTFTPPADNGGTAITGYSATCTSSNGGATRTGTAGANPASIVVGKVTTGKTYTCAVRAANSVGSGAASSSSAPVITGTPAPPGAPKAVRAAAGRIKVTFKIGANNGSAIQKQTATCTSGNGGVTKAGTHNGAKAAPVTVAGLTVGKSYTCKVTAKNARGTGLASGRSNAVTA